MSKVQLLTPSDYEYEQQCRPIADLAELRRYTNGDVELDREILSLFCSGTPVHLNCLKSDCSGALPCTGPEWHLAVHTIKSSAVTIGAWEVAQIAVRLLDMPFDQRTELHCALVQKLDVALEAAYDHVRLLIKQL